MSVPSSSHPASLRSCRGTVLSRYVAALTALDGGALQACLAPEATYRSFLVVAQRSQQPRANRSRSPAPRGSVPAVESDICSAADLPAFTASLLRSVRGARVEVHSVLESADGTHAAVDYTLTGEWSGRLPSMVVGVFDKPICLRCVDTLKIESGTDDASRRVESVHVLLDRLAFLIDIGMAQARL